MRIDQMQEIKDQMESGFYGEWVFYEDDEEREKAYQYLALWKHFFLKKLKGLKQHGHDQIVDRPKQTLGIKFEMRKEEKGDGGK